MRRCSFDNERNTFKVLIQLKGDTGFDPVPLHSFSQPIYWWSPDLKSTHRRDGKNNNIYPGTSFVLEKTQIRGDMLTGSHLVSHSSGQFVHSGSGLCDLLGSIDHVRRVLQWAFSPSGTQTNDCITTESAQHASSFLSAVMKARQSLTCALKTQTVMEKNVSWNPLRSATSAVRWEMSRISQDG